MTSAEMVAIAGACNRYPDVQIAYECAAASASASGDGDGDGEEEEGRKETVEGKMVTVVVELEREWDGDENGTSPLPPAVAPHFPGGRKEESWWLVVGNTEQNAVLAVKKVHLGLKQKSKLKFPAPEAGKHQLKLMLMCDAYLGCDQEYEFTLRTVPSA